MYVISNGHNYIMKRKGGRICATCDINLALQFESKGLAICEINKLPAGYKNGHYTPKSMDEATIVGKSPNIAAPADKPNTYAFQMEDSEWLAKLKKDLVITDRTMCNLNEMYSKVYGDLTAAGDEIDDLEHAIEFKTVNAAQGYQLMAELKRARRKRREAKDAKFLLEIIMNEEDKGWVDGRLETAIEQLGNRKFTPKIRNDLFEKN
ncbi:MULTISPECIES: hypothetical protein [Faecalibacterium]|uniref:hypothetical protein n=1 Tax=Faecalibacterium TaxID=216851 RepID=UPI000E496BF8|nr:MULTISPECIES: hypothetical protein [Faecalibacterium]RHQ27599.1 hypothetical protein DWY95_08585 [Faecalibacterium sp. AF28-13AC]